VPRVISFIVLLAIVLLVGAIFFQVMAQFFVPLFLACVLLVVFAPVQRWIGDRVPDRPRLAALLTTFSIILVVVLPLVWLGWKAYVDFYALLNSPPAEVAAAQEEQPPVAVRKAERAEIPSDSIGVDTQQQKQVEHTLKTFVKGLVDPLANAAHVKVDDATIDRVVALASDFVAKVVITGVHSAISLVVGLFILVIALYYFLADGPSMVEAVMAVSPLDRRYEHELLQRFAEVSRAVVVATLVAALAQGAMASIGYVLVLPEQAPIFLLTALTTVFALIPIFGAFAVWGCVCGWLYVQGHIVAALSLAIYCTIVVSLIDNILKPLILHGQSKLHPLLALLSILGGIEAFGPVGILVGPMLVSFLQALLNMLRKEIESFGGPVGPSSKPLAESMVEAIQMASGENATANAKPAAQPAAETASSHRSKRKR
jgi:predicted PurR-regulated permease PerM